MAVVDFEGIRVSSDDAVASKIVCGVDSDMVMEAGDISGDDRGRVVVVVEPSLLDAARAPTTRAETVNTFVTISKVSMSG